MAWDAVGGYVHISLQIYVNFLEQTNFKIKLSNLYFIFMPSAAISILSYGFFALFPIIINDKLI